MKSAVFTIIAKNYLAHARVLMDSIRLWAPELARIVVLVDQPDGYFNPSQEDFAILLSTDLRIPESRWFHFKYTIMELCTAVKPYVFEALFERGIERVLYLDPDIKVFETLDPLLRNLDQHSVLLTPHLISPLDDGCCPNDLDILRSGSYNLGFIAIRRDSETERFLGWWQVKLYDQCVVDLPRGLFVDQRWIDLVPGLFDGVFIVREPGYNVAYWNLLHRPVRRTRNKGYAVNGSPLYFFHFSGFDPDHPHRFSRHQNRFTLDDIGEAQGLVLGYRDELMARGYAECKRWPYAFGTFANGSPIPDMGRPAHHEMPEVVRRIADPFSDEGFRAFVGLWNEPLAGPDGRPTGITRFAYRIYRARTDVQAAMPNIFGGDLVRFLNWMLSSGRAEHNVDPVFVEPIVEALRASHQIGPVDSISSVSRMNPLVNGRIVQALLQSGIWVNGDEVTDLSALNDLIENGDAKLHLTRLAKAVYQSRPDLQLFFPDPCGRDGIRFLAWFLTYGVHEYRLSDSLAAPLRKQWGAIVDSLNAPQRIWFRLVLTAMRSSLYWRSRARVALDGFGFARTRLSARLSNHRYQAAGEATSEVAGRRRSGLVLDNPGINLVGYLKSEMGVGESVRCALRAARAAQVPTSVRTVDSQGPYRLEDHSAGKTDRHFPHPVNLVHVNADQAENIAARLGSEFLSNRYNIGFWAWELEEFPERWLSSFDLFDEIWTPSTFCQQSIAKKSPIPVVRIPHAIELDASRSLDRSSYSIPCDRFVFLSAFDLLSVFERKNPLAVVQAFSHAFGPDDRCHLVLKINHAEHRPDEMAKIVAAAAGLPVTILDSTLNRSQVNDLIDACDCVVSLHRSEGFGLVLAEGMYLGKPVIATAYSGNLDFMTPENSFLVGYRLVPVPRGCAPYDEGCLWAEPRHEDAIEQMRVVARSPDVRQARAERGRDRIRQEFSAHAVGCLMRERLAHIRPRYAPLGGATREPSAVAGNA